MRLLIIEDDQKIARALKKGLEQESFVCDLAFDAEEGIGLAMTVDYDLIIIDRLLPGEIDGLGICRALRKKGKKVPILILTAKGQIKDRVEGLNAGADDYLVKPFAFEELLARVKALLRRPHNHLGTILKVGDLILDSLNFKVKRNNKEIDLTPTEFRLLEYLMRNPNRILSKENIIEHVWDYDADILPNTVEAFIRFLRNKIDKPFPGSSLIKTIRGFGYKISDKG